MKAFPIIDYVTGENSYIYESKGMDLRDYFAAKAMQAMANAICSMDNLGIIEHRPDDIAQISYVYADAMMKAREK